MTVSRVFGRPAACTSKERRLLALVELVVRRSMEFSAFGCLLLGNGSFLAGVHLRYLTASDERYRRLDGPASHTTDALLEERGEHVEDWQRWSVT